MCCIHLKQFPQPSNNDLPYNTYTERDNDCKINKITRNTLHCKTYIQKGCSSIERGFYYEKIFKFTIGITYVYIISCV